MDETVLGFTPKQIEKYRQLLEGSEAVIPEPRVFDSRAPYPAGNYIRTVASMPKIAEELFSHRPNNSIFAPREVPREEIPRIREHYYSVVRRLSDASTALGREASALLSSLHTTEHIYTEIQREYADFLPFRAALGERDEYSEQIAALDALYRENLSRSLARREDELAALSLIENVCENILPDFLAASSRAADSPSFASLNLSALFRSVTALSEQIRATIRDAAGESI